MYYIEKGGIAIGPIAMNELISHGVKRDTLVWTAGMDTWAAAEQIKALSPLFASMPPPLPSKTGSTSLKRQNGDAPSSGNVSTKTFSARGYSIPKLGVFEDDREVFAMDTDEVFASFSNNVDLKRLIDKGLWFNESYRLPLKGPSGLLFTLYKPKQNFWSVVSNKQELHVLDTKSQLLAICRVSASLPKSGRTHGIVTVEDAQGSVMMTLDSLSLLIPINLDVELMVEGRVIGRLRRSKKGSQWTRAILVHQIDRFELIFESDVDKTLKTVGIGAVIALHFFLLHRWR